jgi:2-oxoisovalerate dehydrogenase E1 component alpha subunit
VVDFPGAKVPTTSRISFVGGADTALERLPCYRTLRSAGQPIPDAAVPYPIDKDLALRMHEIMVKLQVMDLIFYEAQRQVPISSTSDYGFTSFEL